MSTIFDPLPQSIEQTNELLKDKLYKDKKMWQTKITTLISKLKDMRNLSDCQVDMLSYRQILLDNIHNLKIQIYNKNAVWEKKYKDSYRKYTLEYEMRLSAVEKNQFIKADLSDLRILISMIEGQIEYYHESIRTLDNMAFAIRNRIRLEEDL